MLGPPLDLLAHSYKTGCYAADRAFATGRSGTDVEIDTAREVKASLTWGVDIGLKVDLGFVLHSTLCLRGGSAEEPRVLSGAGSATALDLRPSEARAGWMAVSGNQFSVTFVFSVLISREEY